MRITLIEPYFTGSHANWANEYARHSQHHIEILSMRGKYWKWRMHGGAVTLAAEYLNRKLQSDLLLVTDMLDLTTFLALTRRQTATIPVAIYFHESQICYPWSPSDRDVRNKRDHHYGFINYSSALAADRVFFNSQYHYSVFFKELQKFLKHFPDYNEMDTVPKIRDKSQVLHLGLNLQMFDRFSRSDDSNQGSPLILWNHRWEYDKNPEEFFQALYALQDQGLDFRVAILGESFGKLHPIFIDAQSKLGERVVQFGYADDLAHYAGWLHQADIFPVTSHHDFFGASVVEALYCDCYPLLPRRLTYPELLPADRYPDNFYQGFDDLVRKLGQAITKIDRIRQQNFSDHVQRFAWQKMASVYDSELALMQRFDMR